MAADSWVPRHFRELSNRLVTDNGVMLMGIAALGVLVWSQGSVTLLVVLYSINVFLTFSISLLGLVHPVVAQAPRRPQVEAAPRAVRHRAHGHRRDTGGAAGGEVHRGRLGDHPHHRDGDRRLRGHPPPLRRRARPAAQGRRAVRRQGSLGRDRPAPALDPRGADRARLRGQASRRRRARAAVGAAHVPRPLQELRLRERGRGGRAELRRRRGAAHAALHDRELAALLRALLPLARPRRGVLHRLRHRADWRNS